MAEGRMGRDMAGVWGWRDGGGTCEYKGGVQGIGICIQSALLIYFFYGVFRLFDFSTFFSDLPLGSTTFFLKKLMKIVKDKLHIFFS
jgi:hypothetical protein